MSTTIMFTSKCTARRMTERCNGVDHDEKEDEYQGAGESSGEIL